MPSLSFPAADERVIMPDGRMNPNWYRIFLRMAQLLRIDRASGDYTASMVTSSGGDVQSDIDALQGTSVTGTDGLTGGGTLGSGDLALSLDISGIEVIATVDKANDYLLILDATDGKHKLITPTDAGIP